MLGAHVEVQVRLAMSFSAAGQQGSAARALFEESVVEDLARASGFSASNFVVKKVSPGSVVVDLEIHHDSSVCVCLCVCVCVSLCLCVCA